MSLYEPFKHKLNMPEPGTLLLKWIGILVVIALLLFLMQFKTTAFCVFVLAGILFASLVILLMIEDHQDKVLNDMAMKENSKNDDCSLYSAVGTWCFSGDIDSFEIDFYCPQLTGKSGFV